MGLALCLVLAACPEIPQPFRHEGLNPLVMPQAARGVAVRPIPLSYGPGLAEAVVHQFTRAEIPATLREPLPGAWVVEAEPEGGGLRWTLKTPDGEAAASYRQVLPATADAAALQSLAVAAVARLSDPLKGAEAAAPPSDRQAPDRRPKVRLVPPAGLPGDGDAALAKAMKAALEVAGVAVVDDAELVVTGRATAVPSVGGMAVLDIAWVVGKGGAELGKAEQRGEIPRARIEQPWGGLARDIAAGGAEGVVEIVRASAQR